MESLQPYYEKLGVSHPEKLEVSIYTCALSKGQYDTVHKKSYEGKTQIGEMNAVRDFLRDRFIIPEENIERRYFTNNLTLPFLGQYQTVPTIVGVTKMGEIFHTSLVAEDVFGLKNVELPPELKNFENFSKLPAQTKFNLFGAFSTVVLFPIVRGHFVGSKERTDNCKYGGLKFFSSEELNIPATSLPKMFSLKFGSKGLVEGKNPFIK
jgi:hypothetical protein